MLTAPPRGQKRKPQTHRKSLTINVHGAQKILLGTFWCVDPHVSRYTGDAFVKIDAAVVSGGPFIVDTDGGN